MIYSQAQAAPLAIIYCLVLLAVGGAATLLWGKRLPRGGDWLIGVFLVFLLAALAYAGNNLLDDGGGSKIWIRGWIWPVDSVGAMAIGILQDPLGLVMAGLTIFYSAVLLANWRLTTSTAGTEARSERFYSAVAFSATGATLSWVSLTPWFSFLGLVLASLGGFISLGLNWNDEAEAKLAVRYMRQRLFGIFLSVIGACGICGARSALLWLQGAPTAEVETWISGAQAISISEGVGIVFLIAGLLIQFQPVILLSWLVAPSRGKVWSRISLTQILPAWTAFALLLRLQNHLGQIEYFTVFGWILLVSTTGSVFSGLLQSQWQSGLSTWISAGLTFSAAVLCFGNCSAALSLIIGVGLGGTAFAMSNSASHGQKGKTPTALRVGSFLGIAAATGVIGFGSSEGWCQWVSQIWMDPILSSAGILTFVLFVVLGWKLAWSSDQDQKESTSISGAIQALPLLLVFFALGLLWTGAASGGTLPGAPDRLFNSLMTFIFSAAYIPAGAPGGVFADHLNFPAVGASLGAVLVSVGIAFWAARRIPKNITEGDEPSKKFYRFIASGYGTDSVAEKVRLSFSWISTFLGRWLDDRIWNRALPQSLSAVMRRSTSLISEGDGLMSSAMRSWLRLWVDPPAKFLQLIQSGDVQWYLFFGLGSGFAILIHFLWNANVGVIK